MKTNWLATVLSAALLVAGAITGIVHANDSVTDLGTLPFGTVSNAFSVNDAGQVCGQASASGFGANHACLWAGGPAQDLGTLPGGSTSIALGINNVGQVCGFSDQTIDGLRSSRACLWSGGALQALPPLDGLTDSEAYGINDQGQVCGDSYGSVGTLFVQRACVWTGGVCQDLPPLPGDGSSVAFGINNLGQVCGISYGDSPVTRSCVWTNGVPVELARPVGVDTAIALGINDAGQVCGYTFTDAQRAIRWTNGQPQTLPAFPGGTTCYPSYGGINQAGQVAGVAEGVLNGVTYQHACVWVGGNIQDLGALSNPNKPLGVSGGNGINNKGQACGNSNPGKSNHAALFTLGMADVTPPAISTPKDAFADTEPGQCSASLNPGQATAVDDVDGPVAVTGTRSDGKALSDPFPGGVTQITWSARDAAGNPASSVQTVTVTDREKPVLTLPKDIDTGTDPNACASNVRAGEATATDNCGFALVSGVRSDGKDLSQPYPVGKTLITWTATDPAGNSVAGVQSITVAARSSVSLTVPEDKKAATDPGKCSAAVDPGTATAADPCPGLQVSGVRGDGKALSDPYPVGTTQITWTATDAYGNSASGTQNVTVTDGEKPVVMAPNDLALNTDPGKCSASGQAGQATASDNCGVASLSGARSDGKALSDPYPVGQTTITWTATDAAGNSASGVQTVTVKDAEAPVLSAVKEVATSTDAGKCSATVMLAAPTATDNCGLALVSGVRGDGKSVTDAYPVGVTTITWTAMDAAGNTTSVVQTVTVKDATAPVISGLSATPDRFFPPNHKMVPVTLSYTVTDGCDSNPTVTLSITSSESANQEVDGDGEDGAEPCPAEGQIVDAHHVNVRSDRSGQGTGRVYFITITATDHSGNSSSKVVTVTIPKSRKK